VDFIIDSGGRLELFEAKWTELPSDNDTVNLSFVRNAVGKSRVSAAGIICRTRNEYSVSDGIRVMPIE
jgi:uncharacterized protein